MATYIYQQKASPKFVWQDDKLAALLAAVSRKQGRLLGRMTALGFTLRAEAVLQSLTEEVVKSSEIEGESLDRDQVRSSIARRLGMDIGALAPADRECRRRRRNGPRRDRALRQATDRRTSLRMARRAVSNRPQRHEQNHRRRLAHRQRQGQCRSSQVPSAASACISKRPKRKRLDGGNERAFSIGSTPSTPIDPVIKAAIAHLWFVTIHPFEDGNGRIARAIADMALARSEQSAQRFYSMSAQIRKERNAYYDILEATQQGELDITPWLDWFLGLSRSGLRFGRDGPRKRVQESALLGEICRCEAQRSTAQGHQSPSGR